VCFGGAGLIAAVGISQLQFTDANSPRNIFIVGLGLYLVRQSAQTIFVAENLVSAQSSCEGICAAPIRACQ